tara:strand:- start:1107 stop:1283 length:177 start_codon:yes stop_codon:yes gene_type:complete
MTRCTCNRSRQGRAICQTPERCDAEQFGLADGPMRSIWPRLAASLALVGLALLLSFAS